MNKIAISMGPFEITWYSVCIFIGILFAWFIISKEAKRNNIPPTFVTNLIFWCVVFGILGARIYYVLFNLDYYTANPEQIIKIWNGGLAIHGGMIAGLITMVIKGMHISGHYYHPTFLYESLFCIIGFFVLVGIRSLKSTKLGNTTAIYLIWYGIVRFFVESLRTDSLMLANLKMAQIVSVLMIVTGIIMFIITKIKCKYYSSEVAGENEIIF